MSRTMKWAMLLVLVAFVVAPFNTYASHNSGNKKSKKCEQTTVSASSHKGKKKKSCKPKCETTQIGTSHHNGGNKGDNCQKKCLKAQKYLTKSQNASKPKYQQKYYEKYLKYSAKYCPTTPPPPPNTAPVATGDELTIEAGKSQSITLNATDAQDAKSALIFTVEVASGQGTVVNNNDGTVTYTAPATPGTYTFTFTAKDTKDLVSNVATIQITVTNTAPVATDGSGTVEAGKSIPVTLDATDLQDAKSALVFATDIASGQGTVVNNNDGTVTYTAPENAGTYTFTFTATDTGSLVSNVATITITVTAAPNDPPVANDSTYDVSVGQEIEIVLGASDLQDGTNLTYSITSQPELVSNDIAPSGQLVKKDGAAANVYVYTASSTIGTVKFKFTATDSKNAVSNEATVTINVHDSVDI